MLLQCLGQDSKLSKGFPTFLAGQKPLPELVISCEINAKQGLSSCRKIHLPYVTVQNVNRTHFSLSFKKKNSKVKMVYLEFIEIPLCALFKQDHHCELGSGSDSSPGETLRVVLWWQVWMLL